MLRVIVTLSFQDFAICAAKLLGQASLTQLSRGWQVIKNEFVNPHDSKFPDKPAGPTVCISIGGARSDFYHWRQRIHPPLIHLKFASWHCPDGQPYFDVPAVAGTDRCRNSAAQLSDDARRLFPGDLQQGDGRDSHTQGERGAVSGFTK